MKQEYDYRGRYERSELLRIKLAIPYAEQRVAKYQELLDEETQNLSDLYQKAEQLEKEAV